MSGTQLSSFGWEDGLTGRSERCVVPLAAAKGQPGMTSLLSWGLVTSYPRSHCDLGL